MFPSLIVLSETTAAKKIFSGSFWSYGAKVALNVYIWHVCIEIIYRYMLLKIPSLSDQPEWAMMLCILGVDWIVGILSRHFIEKPLAAKTDRLCARYFASRPADPLPDQKAP